MSTVVITGAEGQLAYELCHQIGRHAVPLSRRELDITDPAEVRRVIAELQPRAVINAAAYTSVDAAQRDPAACWAVNSQGVQYLAESCGRLGAALVQISSDYVFGADRDRDLPYSETDLPGPENCGSTGIELNSLDRGERGYAGFRSMHPGNVLFVLCDGSTRSISENIQRDVLSAIGTRAGSEAVQMP